MAFRGLERWSIVGLALVSSLAFAGWKKAGGESKAGFSGKGPAGFKITGETKSVDVKDDGTNLTITVELKDLETGIALRDNHMRNKYIEVEKYPDATLSVPLASLKVPEDGKSVEADAKGTFSVHGVSKDASFHYKASCKGGTCEVTGSADVNFNAHGIKVPSYMGITVKPDIQINTSFKMKKD